MVHLPTGTVTFLFTDIQGSTSLWQQYPDVMPAVIARHDALLAEIVETHAGTVFRTVGDAVNAAFAKPEEAVSAAVAAQQALAAEPWPGGITIRVRMGIHTGAVDLVNGQYTGHTLNRVARITAAGHGGQILVSATAAGLARDALRSGPAFRDLGEHRLKDLVLPERIYAVEAVGVTSEFPPLQTLEVPRTNLPSLPVSLVGRNQEVEAAAALLTRDEVSLVTFTGTGGMGKTSLAIAVGHNLVDRFPDGVWFVSLASITDPALVASAITAVLGLHEEGNRTAAQMLQDFLRSRRTLLILDNFEQLIGAAVLIAELLEAAPATTALVTSRIALRLRAEREFPVSPLAVPDPEGVRNLDRLARYAAVQVFVARAQQVKPGFALTDENAEVIAEICSRLDGLPLAIELAAARVRILSPEALLTRLERRLPLLTGGGRDLPVRQQTMEAAIAWSYDLLTHEEQRLYRHLCVFVGGFTLEQAEGVCAVDGNTGNILDCITSLVDKSLLQQEDAAGEPRFSMLQTIREYGLERLAECAEAEDLRRRHACYFAGLAESLQHQGMAMGPGPIIRSLERERDNFRAALDWCAGQTGDTRIGLQLMGAMMFLWAFGGHSAEGRRRAETLLTRSDAEQYPDELAGTFVTLGALEEFAHESPLAISHLTASEEILRRSGDRARLSAALQWMGITAIGRGEIERAIEYETQSRDHARAANLPWLEATALSFLAEAMIVKGNLNEVRAIAEEAVQGYAALHDAWGMARMQKLLAGIAWLEGNYAAAHRLCEQAIGPLRQAGEHWNLARTLTRMGIILFDEGRYEEAESMLMESLVTWRDLANEGGVILSLAGLAAVAVAQGQADRAIHLYTAEPFHQHSVQVHLDTLSNHELNHLLEHVRKQLGNEEPEDHGTIPLERALHYALEWPASAAAQ
jgi:predicted ATPase/class 3 adenylate cyclase